MGNKIISVLHAVIGDYFVTLFMLSLSLRANLPPPPFRGKNNTHPRTRGRNHFNKIDFAPTEINPREVLRELIAHVMTQ